MASDQLILAQGIHKTYHLGDVAVEVLRGVDVVAQRGEVIAVVGPSGVGKSTLLHILGGLDRPDAGSLTVDGIDVFAQSEVQLAEFRNRQIGFVFQFHHLLGDFTALENVMMPLLIQGLRADAAREPALRLLDRVGLRHRATHLPSELSGGESQRVAVARALVASPAVVLADEPSGNLDGERSTALHQMLRELAHDLGQTFIVATHDRTLSDHVDRVIRMSEGRVVDSGD